MKYLFTIFCRLSLIAMMLTALICTSTLAGISPTGFNCGAECCQPEDHHAAGAAKVRLSSVNSMNCCGGMAGQPCDLQAPNDARQALNIHAIQSTCIGTAIAANVQVIKINDSQTDISSNIPRMMLPETTPIYIELQSIII